jgi:hypothetical protein
LHKTELQAVVQRLVKMEGKLEKAFLRLERLKMLRVNDLRKSAFLKADEIVGSHRQASQSPAAEDL